MTKEEGSSDTETLTIKRLKEKEMIFEVTDNNLVTRVEAEPK